MKAPAETSTKRIEALTADIGGQKLHGLAAGPAGAPAMLLLHGAAFHSGTWEKLGTLAFLGQQGFRALAIDLPGFARSKEVRAARDTFLQNLLPALGLQKPVVLFASMSGRFAFPLIVDHPDRLSGFVAIAPVGIEHYTARLASIALPALIVWGDRDTVIPIAEADLLANALPGSRKLILQGARHPCYLDRPAEFHAALVAFLREVASAGSSDRATA